MRHLDRGTILQSAGVAITGLAMLACSVGTAGAQSSPANPAGGGPAGGAPPPGGPPPGAFRAGAAFSDDFAAKLAANLSLPVDQVQSALGRSLRRDFAARQGGAQGLEGTGHGGHAEHFSRI